MRRALAAALALTIALQPLAEAAPRAAAPERLSSVNFALAQKQSLMAAELTIASSWLRAPAAEASQERLRARLAALALAEAQPGAAEREALAKGWNPDTLSAFDGFAAVIAKDPALRARVKELRSELELAALAPMEAFDRAQTGLKDHVVVAGLDHAGTRVVDALIRLKKPVAVVAEQVSAQTRAELASRGVPLVEGKPGQDDVLERAGVRSAKALIVATGKDLDALSFSLDARRQAPDVPVIAAVDDWKLARPLETSLNVRWAVSIARLAAPVFAAAVYGEKVKAAFSLDGHPYTAGYLDPSTIPRAVGEPLSFFAKMSNTAPAALRRGGKLLMSPDPSTVVAEGDEILVVMETGAWQRLHGDVPSRSSQYRGMLLRALYRLAGVSSPARRTLTGLAVVAFASMLFFGFALGLAPIDAFYFVMSTITTTGYGDINLLNAPWYVKLYGGLVMLMGALLISLLSSVFRGWLDENRRPTPRHPVVFGGHTVVVGGGMLGYRTVKELLRRGKQVIFVDKDADGAASELLRPEVPVVNGDPTRSAVLEKAKLGKADSIIVAGDNDAENLSVMLQARALNREARATVRTFDPELARDLSGTMGLQAALSASTIAAPALVGDALRPDGVLTLFAGGRMLQLDRREAGKPAAAGAAPLLFRRPGRREFEQVLPGARVPPGSDVVDLSSVQMDAPSPLLHRTPR